MRKKVVFRKLRRGQPRPVGAKEFEAGVLKMLEWAQGKARIEGMV